MSNYSSSVVYVGVTNNLERRIYEHKNHLIDGFTKKYNTNKLVYYECADDIKSAIVREKEIKGWTREKKNNLINSMNEKWIDLSVKWNND